MLSTGVELDLKAPEVLALVRSNQDACVPGSRAEHTFEVGCGYPGWVAVYNLAAVGNVIGRSFSWYQVINYAA